MTIAIPEPSMAVHTFELFFSYVGDLDTAIEALAENCTDALVGCGVEGKLALLFDREGASRETAVESAVADVLKAVPSAVRETR